MVTGTAQTLGVYPGQHCEKCIETLLSAEAVLANSRRAGSAQLGALLNEVAAVDEGAGPYNLNIPLQAEIPGCQC
jgi:hypothetical protein